VAVSDHSDSFYRSSHLLCGATSRTYQAVWALKKFSKRKYLEKKAMSDEIVQQIKERMYTDAAFRDELLTSPLRVLQEYALTEEEKQLFVAPNCGWLVVKRLAGVSYPRSEDAIALLHNIGVWALLSLSQETVPTDLLRKYQMQRKHLPMADFTAPTLEQVEQALTIIDDFLADGLPVAVHCGAGLGRTGTILACYLVSQGSSAKDAIELVRMKRPGSIETTEQEAVIEAYEQAYQNKQ
jgi:atypical dual specificity phosphatase